MFGLFLSLRVAEGFKIAVACSHELASKTWKNKKHVLIPLKITLNDRYISEDGLLQMFLLLTEMYNLK